MESMGEPASCLAIKLLLPQFKSCWANFSPKADSLKISFLPL